MNDALSELAPSTITTVAGAGLRDGIPARDADAGWPLGVVRRPDGDLIVADYHAHILWRIDGDGILHRFAGDSVPGSSGDGGPAIDARFNCPHDLAQDKDGNLYLSDLCNQTYRRIDYKTGIITRVAGSGRTGRGGDGGPAVEAEMDTHCGIAVDDDGNLYLSSEWANNIRRVDAATGVVELFRRPGRPPPSLRERWQPPVRRPRPQPRRLLRRRRPKGSRRVPPPGAPGVRLQGRPLRLRQLQPPDPQDRHEDGHRLHRSGHRSGGLQRRRGAGLARPAP